MYHRNHEMPISGWVCDGYVDAKCVDREKEKDYVQKKKMADMASNTAASPSAEAKQRGPAPSDRHAQDHR
jgi:hypothetical protein